MCGLLSTWTLKFQAFRREYILYGSQNMAPFTCYVWFMYVLFLGMETYWFFCRKWLIWTCFFGLVWWPSFVNVRTFLGTGLINYDYQVPIFFYPVLSSLKYQNSCRPVSSNRGLFLGREKRFFFPPNHPHRTWGTPSIQFHEQWWLSLQWLKRPEHEVDKSVALAPKLKKVQI